MTAPLIQLQVRRLDDPAVGLGFSIRARTASPTNPVDLPELYVSDAGAVTIGVELPINAVEVDRAPAAAWFRAVANLLEVADEDEALMLMALGPLLATRPRSSRSRSTSPAPRRNRKP